MAAIEARHVKQLCAEMLQVAELRYVYPSDGQNASSALTRFGHLAKRQSDLRNAAPTPMGLSAPMIRQSSVRARSRF